MKQLSIQTLFYGIIFIHHQINAFFLKLVKCPQNRPNRPLCVQVQIRPSRYRGHTLISLVIYLNIFLSFRISFFTSKILFGLQEATWSLPGGSWRLIQGIYKSKKLIYVPTCLNICFLGLAFQFLHKKKHLATWWPPAAYLEADPDVFQGQDFNFHIKIHIWPPRGHLELTWRLFLNIYKSNSQHMFCHVQI